MGGMQRLVTLAPAPESARQARRFVGEVLTSAGATRFLDIAVLLTSELVTNGIVHAHTHLKVVVEATPTWVRVEVIDGNPMLPARRDYTDEALTGRGLEMVELLAQEFGMQPLGDDGKRVWFRLGEAAVTPAERPDAPAGLTDGRPDAITVTLVNLPVVLYNAWQEHADAVLREATLAAMDRAGGEIPEEFAAASHAMTALASAVTDLLPRADAGVRHVDVVVRLPRVALPGFAALRDVLRRSNEMSAAGDLLVPPSLPEIQAVRRWVCDEVGRQAQDLPARPWSEPSVEDAPVDALSADAVDEVRASQLAQVAADRWNRIIAVSDEAAALLGWRSSELEGRRLISIIPERLRDRHVAGFTRQQLGGPSRMVGVPTDVPALRRDGTEIEVRLLIEARTDVAGRRVFVATLTQPAV